jgi:hypothetical protein
MFSGGSANALKRCISEGSLVACDVVWAEISAWFPDEQSAQSALTTLRFAYSRSDGATALAAGRTWQSYRKA